MTTASRFESVDWNRNFYFGHKTTCCFHLANVALLQVAIRIKVDDGVTVDAADVQTVFNIVRVAGFARVEGDERRELEIVQLVGVTPLERTLLAPVGSGDPHSLWHAAVLRTLL